MSDDSKTIGQILREARNAWELHYTETGVYDPNWREPCDEASASAVWDTAVEACISKMEEVIARAKHVDDTEGAWVLQGAVGKLEALKRSQSQTGTDDVCQAKSSTQGETVSAAPLQATAGGDAFEEWQSLMRKAINVQNGIASEEERQIVAESLLRRLDREGFQRIASFLQEANSQGQTEEDPT